MSDMQIALAGFFIGVGFGIIVAGAILTMVLDSK